MQFEQLIAIIPLARIDPEPAELTEQLADATLGSYRALWHPALLSRSATLPVWARAADPPVAAPGQLILIPEASRRFLPSGWDEQAGAAGAQVVAGEESSAGFLARIRDCIAAQAGSPTQPIDAADFHALGMARLWLEMLTAYMRHVNTLDEDHFRKEVLAAASAAALGDSATCDNHLRAAFGSLKEARERLYSANVHLLDFCLLHPHATADRLGRQLDCGVPINFFSSGHTAEQLGRAEPAAIERLRAALERSEADLIGGEYDELACTLLPLESHLWQFRRGERSYREVLGRVPTIFGRRRFGLARHVLTLLNRLEMYSLTHFSFDDGIFPAVADAKVRFEAPDTATVEALTRIPFAADKSLDFLKFPHALARTMSGDFVATLTLVHWPMPDAPWYGDLQRITRYATVFGSFVTLSHYFQTTDPPAISTRLSNDQYASPFLHHAHQRGEARPISEFAEHHRLRARLETMSWLAAVEQSLSRRHADRPHELEELEERLELRHGSVGEQLDSTEQRLLQCLAPLISPPAAGARPGLLVFNSLGFDRRVVLRLPTESAGSRAAGGRDDAASRPVLATDRGGDREERPWVGVDLPAMGFAWVPLTPEQAVTEPTASAAAVEGHTIRNEHLEVEIDADSGGIRAVRDRASGANHLGQRLVLAGIPGVRRDSSDATSGTLDDGYAVEPPKSEMRATTFSVRAAGPEIAEVVVEGDLLAVPCPAWAAEPRMARFRQSFRLGRGQRAVRVVVEILDLVGGALDAHAGPWQSYLASRFAWPDSRSLLVRAVGTLAEASRAERPETPYFIELHERRHRTAILTGGLPFQQRFGERMLDMLLVTPTETGRIFEFAFGIDLPNPFHAALDLITPPAMIATEGGPPPGGTTGWFFHLDAPNIVITSMTPLGPEATGVRVRLFESAGRYTRSKLRCLRSVLQARLTDFRGQRLATLDTQDDAVTLDLSPHEITQLEIEFA